MANERVELGVPKQDIVLAYHSPLCGNSQNLL
ncbi:MAG: hypothetical protein HC769_15645 [Cyanobacteria bacterium CRU_2_1]|nr:hypothetical protein [Cyanobacteria bacterium RU_5_0]NJR60136.1 hypothetical protein [Cyanobacteria bacterium CRU_2_1]